MRKDMVKVLVERPRHVDKPKYRARPRVDETAPAKVSLRGAARELGGQKSFGDHLGPLRRYLDKQVGRPWNKVFAEIIASLTGSAVLRRHLRDHLFQFVNVDTGPHSQKPWRNGLWVEIYYVDPMTGLLRRTADLVRHPPQAPVERPDRIVLDGQLELRRLNGIWFEVLFAPLPAPEYRDDQGLKWPARYSHASSSAAITCDAPLRTLANPPLRDVLTGMEIAAGPDRDEPVAWADYRRGRRAQSYAMAKKQLSARELRRHGLANAR